MAKKTLIGLDGKLYRNNGGTWASPTWAEQKNCKDLSLGLEKTEAEANTRETAWGLVKGALKNATIEFSMIYDPLDPAWIALKTAWLGNTTVEYAVMDGTITVDGSEGLHADFEVLKWTHTQNLEEVMVTEVSLKPARTDNVPEWKVIEV